MIPKGNAGVLGHDATSCKYQYIPKKNRGRLIGDVLARHGLTDTIPACIDTPLPRGSRIQALRETVYVHVFDRETFDLGREEFSIDEQAL